jgi:hypothetical protein
MLRAEAGDRDRQRYQSRFGVVGIGKRASRAISSARRIIQIQEIVYLYWLVGGSG